MSEINNRTINGMSFKEILEELKKPFTHYSTDFNGKPTIPFELVKSRANEVLGLNYSDEVETKYHVVEGEHLIEAKVTIKIYDDCGLLVASRSHVRSDTLTRYAKGKPNEGKLSFDNDGISPVVSLAYKKAFALLELGNQFSVNKAHKIAINKYVDLVNVDKEKDSDASKEKGVKAVFTLTKTNRAPEGDSVTFLNDDGKSYVFDVKDPSGVEGYKELLTATPGALVTTFFLLPSRKLLKVEVN